MMYAVRAVAKSAWTTGALVGRLVGMLVGRPVAEVFVEGLGGVVWDCMVSFEGAFVVTCGVFSFTVSSEGVL